MGSITWFKIHKSWTHNSYSELKIKHENEQLQKAKLRMLQKESFIWQKLQGMKLKDRNWKQKERNSEIHDNNTPSTSKTLTERVRKHREKIDSFSTIYTIKSQQHSSKIKKHLQATPNNQTNALKCSQFAVP